MLTQSNVHVCVRGFLQGVGLFVSTWLLHASHDVHGNRMAQHVVFFYFLQLKPVLVSSFQLARHTPIW